MRAIRPMPQRRMRWKGLVGKAWAWQIEQDFSEIGAGIVLPERCDAEFKAGRSAPLEEFLAQWETVPERTCLAGP